MKHKHRSLPAVKVGTTVEATIGLKVIHTLGCAGDVWLICEVLEGVGKYAPLSDAYVVMCARDARDPMRSKTTPKDVFRRANEWLKSQS